MTLYRILFLNTHLCRSDSVGNLLRVLRILYIYRCNIKVHTTRMRGGERGAIERSPRRKVEAISPDTIHIIFVNGTSIAAQKKKKYELSRIRNNRVSDD